MLYLTVSIRLSCSVRANFLKEVANCSNADRWTSFAGKYYMTSMLHLAKFRGLLRQSTANDKILGKLLVVNRSNICFEVNFRKYDNFRGKNWIPQLGLLTQQNVKFCDSAKNSAGRRNGLYWSTPSRHLPGIAAVLQNVTRARRGEVSRLSTSIAASTRKLIGIKRTSRMSRVQAPCSVSHRASVTATRTKMKGRRPPRTRDLTTSTSPVLPCCSIICCVIDTWNQYRQSWRTPIDLTNTMRLRIRRFNC